MLFDEVSFGQMLISEMLEWNLENLKNLIRTAKIQSSF